jgi:arsenate reductase (thioredoxin)
MMTRKQNVLFLCNGNSARSQIAEAFLRRYAGEQFEVYSAGIHPKGIHPMTAKVMNEKGYDLDGQYSKGTKEYMGKLDFRYLITVCEQSDRECPQALWAIHGTKLAWPFDDPVKFDGSDQQKLDQFRAVRDQIEGRIKAWVSELNLG